MTRIYSSSSDNSDVSVMSRMKSSLPCYIVNCFEAAGYDTLEAIQEMNDASITEIEKFIDQRKNFLPLCLRPNFDDVSSSVPFQFPPGHRIIISKFISSIQQKNTSSSEASDTLKLPLPFSKKRKIAKKTDSEEDIPLVAQEIRGKILKWTKHYNEGELAALKEGVDFNIVVSKSTLNPDTCNASISCRCGNSYLVTANAKGERLISNWSRHIKQCGKKKSKTQTGQGTLQQFLKGPQTSMSSTAIMQRVTSSPASCSTLSQRQTSSDSSHPQAGHPLQLNPILYSPEEIPPSSPPFMPITLSTKLKQTKKGILHPSIQQPQTSSTTITPVSCSTSIPLSQLLASVHPLQPNHILYSPEEIPLSSPPFMPITLATEMNKTEQGILHPSIQLPQTSNDSSTTITPVSCSTSISLSQQLALPIAVTSLSHNSYLDQQSSLSQPQPNNIVYSPEKQPSSSPQSSQVFR